MLDLQTLDSTLSQLDHRLSRLPEQAALVALEERRRTLSDTAGTTQTEVEDLSRDQRKADADVEQVKTRRTRNRERLEAGVVSDPKQVQAMQHEIETLDRRIGDLEDDELDVMERLDDAQHRLASLTTEISTLDSDIATQTVTRDAVAGEIATAQTDAREARIGLVEKIPTDLLTLYDKLRRQLGGVGVGALRHKRCGGCRLDVGAADLARMAAAPDDEVLRCEECDRILVRVSDSGL